MVVTRLCWAVILAGVLVLFSLAANAAVLGQTDQEVQAVAEPLLEGVLAGFNDGNYAKYSQNFDETLKEAISEKKFQKVRAQILKTLGKYRSRTYLGFLKKGGTTLVLWRGRFTKSDDDVLIKLVASKRQDRYVVVGLWFQ